jgi:hypothetical protein
MPRRKRSDAGERATVKRTVRLTPSGAAALDTAARETGATFARFARAILESWSSVAPAVTGARLNPEMAALKRAMETAGREENAIGNLLNQIARHIHMTGEIRDRQELSEALAMYTKASERHREALERVIAL